MHYPTSFLRYPWLLIYTYSGTVVQIYGKYFYDRDATQHQFYAFITCPFCFGFSWQPSGSFFYRFLNNRIVSPMIFRRLSVMRKKEYLKQNIAWMMQLKTRSVIFMNCMLRYMPPKAPHLYFYSWEWSIRNDGQARKEETGFEGYF